MPKVAILNSQEEVRRFLERHQESATDLVLQEIIEGEDEDHVFCVLYVDARHQVVGVSTGQTIHRYQPKFGRTASCITRDFPSLSEACARFMAGERYVGLVELEFKRDCRDGAYKLFEVNTRTWAYNGLGPACGVDLVHLAYLEATDQPLPSEPVRGRSGVTWVNAEMEAGFLWKTLKRGRLPKLPWRLLGPRTAHSKLAWDDPLPALQGVIYRVGRLLSQRKGAPEPPRTSRT